MQSNFPTSNGTSSGLFSDVHPAFSSVGHFNGSFGNLNGLVGTPPLSAPVPEGTIHLDGSPSPERVGHDDQAHRLAIFKTFTDHNQGP